jgi:nitrite reductase/ring-hydroxylating ferredoxin subunit
MKHVEKGETEILLANVKGKFYALSDRCGHMSARLSMGELHGNIIVCPLHSSRFDVTDGKTISRPIQESVQGIEKCPEETQKSMQSVAELVTIAKTYDLPILQVKVEGKNILIDI